MNTALLMPDDRSPEERARDAFDEMEIENTIAEGAQRLLRLRRRQRVRAWFTPMRISLLVITAFWSGIMLHIADTYSPHVAWLCILCTAWGIAAGFLLTYEWIESGREEE